MQCSAEHRAVRHHAESTDGAARHAGRSGLIRPCVTGHRRRRSNASQGHMCIGPARQKHTSTQRAHNTHSPPCLPVPVGRHPGHCLLVTAPLAHQIPRTREEKDTQGQGHRGARTTQQRGCRKKQKKRDEEAGAGSHKAPRPRAPRAPKKGKAETTRAQKKKERAGGGGQPQSAEAQGTRGRKKQKDKRKGGAKKRGTKTTQGHRQP